MTTTSTGHCFVVKQQSRCTVLVKSTTSLQLLQLQLVTAVPTVVHVLIVYVGNTPDNTHVQIWAKGALDGLLIHLGTDGRSTVNETDDEGQTVDEGHAPVPTSLTFGILVIYLLLGKSAKKSIIQLTSSVLFI